MVGMTVLGKAVPYYDFALPPVQEKETYPGRASCIRDEMNYLHDVRVQSTMMD
jgi:hypothetical protein